MPTLGFFEVISENFFGGGRPRYYLDRCSERYPIVLHGVSLGLGGPEEPDRDTLRRIKELCRVTGAPWVSDHLCWTGSRSAHLHDLLPLPYTADMVRRVARRARQVQDYLEVPFALENTSSYLTYQASEIPEWEFVSSVVEEADCGLLFDVNNVYVSAFNHGWDALSYVRHVPHHRIVQIHVAGHTHFGSHIIDTHVGPVPPPVLELYCEALRLTGPVSTLIEWDDQIPDFAVLLDEVARFDAARKDALR